jgi:hypothetical protein
MTNTSRLPVITYGPHLLITKKINIDSLITYIEGQIDSKSLSLDSGYEDDEDDITRLIVFKYRLITFKERIHSVVSKNNYSEIINIDNSNNQILNYNINNKMKKILNIIPKTFDFYKNLKKIKNNKDINGELYEYKDYFILIYDITENKKEYKGIIYKNNSEYIKFSDHLIDIKRSHFIRKINNNSINIKDGVVNFIDSEIKSKLIDNKKRELIFNKKFGTFDFECYLDENNKFKPFLCYWYTENKSNYYYLTDYNYDSDKMIYHFINDMRINCPNYIFYAHNLGKFDVHYILKILLSKKIFCKNQILFNEIKPISIKSYNIIKKNLIGLSFKDSYLV